GSDVDQDEAAVDPGEQADDENEVGEEQDLDDVAVATVAWVADASDAREAARRRREIAAQIAAYFDEADLTEEERELMLEDFEGRVAAVEAPAEAARFGRERRRR